MLKAYVLFGNYTNKNIPSLICDGEVSDEWKIFHASSKDNLLKRVSSHFVSISKEPRYEWFYLADPKFGYHSTGVPRKVTSYKIGIALSA